MAQLVTRVDEALAARVDELVSEGVVSSRSEAVRLGLEGLLEKRRRRLVGERIVTGYERTPQSDDELTGLDASTRALIKEEPW